MRTEAEAFRHLGCCQHGPNRHPPAQGLGERHNIRAHPFVFMGEKFSGSADTDLHLVKNEQQPVAVAQLTQPSEIAVGRHDHPTLALNRFDQNCNGFIRQGRFHGRQVSKRHIAETLQHRPESLADFFLTGGGNRGHGPTVERAQRGENLVAPLTLIHPIFARQFNRSFVGLGPAVAKEHLVGKRMRTQQFGQTRLRNNMVQIGNMGKRRNLFLHGFDHRGVALPQVHHRQAGKKIQIGLPLRVPQATAFTPDKGNRKTGIGGTQILIIQVNDFLAVHMLFPLAALSKKQRHPILDTGHAFTVAILSHLSRCWRKFTPIHRPPVFAKSARKSLTPCDGLLRSRYRL